MGACLHAAYELAIDANIAYLSRTHDGNYVAELTPAEAVFISLLDGSSSFEEIEQLAFEALGKPAFDAFRMMCRRLDPLLTYDTRPPSPYSIERLSSLGHPDSSSRFRARPGPQILHWCVTRVCPRKCAYCFANPVLGHSAVDATLERERLKELFTEAKSLGTEGLLVAGSEPFLRKDLPEVIGDALEVGLETLVTTKHPFDRQLAQRVARAGLRHLSISIDSTDSDVNKRLIGSSNYARQVQLSVENLAFAGVAFSFQSVVTQLDPEGFEGVVELAEQTGARVVEVVPFEQISKPITVLGNRDLELVGPSNLDEQLDATRVRYPSVEVRKFEGIGVGNQSDMNCDIGLTKLFFLPDGRVHRCYKLTHDDGLSGTDLRDHSIAYAWHSQWLREQTNPPIASYAGSGCSTCSRFDGCHDSGRCIYAAEVKGGSYTSPDRSCSGPYTSDAVRLVEL